MIDQEENSSGDEINHDNDWPADFFDAEDEKSLFPYSGPSLTDIFPIEILRMIVEPLGLRDRSEVYRCSRAMREAVTTSICFGEERIHVSNHKTSDLSFMIENPSMNLLEAPKRRNQIRLC
ncbi:hypothetical protein PENTCL1PPCAC_3467, partial [Pristionchus entomophagus]